MAFGETFVEDNRFDWATIYKFNGKEQDCESGLYNYGARYYDPKISRWLSVDPLTDEMVSWSPYNYTFNNPVNYVDPDGRKPIFPSWKVMQRMISYSAMFTCSLVGANNTSPKHFNEWARGRASQTNILGAIGEGVAGYRLLTEIGVAANEAGLGVIRPTIPLFGMYSNGQQVDIMTVTKVKERRLNSLFKIKTLTIITGHHFNGTDREVVYGENSPLGTKFRTMYEVKTIDPTNIGGNFDAFIHGISQVAQAAGSSKTDIGVLVMDKQAWTNLTKSAYSTRLKSLYNKFIKDGFHLKLMDGLHSEAKRGMHGMKDHINKFPE